MPRGTSRYDEARLQGRLWTPAVWVGSEIGAWYDGGDRSTVVISSGSNISTLKDKSGNGNDLTVGAGTPTYSPDTGAINFAAAAYLTRAATTGINLPGANAPRTHIAVHQWANTSDSDCSTIAQGVQNPGFGSSLHRFSGSDPEYTAYGGDINGSALFPFTAARQIAAAQIGAGSGGSTAPGQLFRNGVVGATGNTDTSNLTTTNGIYLNKTSWTSAVAHTIWEALILKHAADYKRVKVEGYLAWKWGMVEILAATHPYKNRPPTIGG